MTYKILFEKLYSHVLFSPPPFPPPLPGMKRTSVGNFSASFFGQKMGEVTAAAAVAAFAGRMVKRPQISTHVEKQREEEATRREEEEEESGCCAGQILTVTSNGATGISFDYCSKV
jgi:hypothetical protein